MIRMRWFVGILVLVLGGLVWAVTSGASEKAPGVDSFTQGLPDHIPVTDRMTAEVVGTIEKSDYIAARLEARQGTDERPLEVVDAQGRKVGHMWPGIGFVSLEEQSRPDFDPERLRDAVTVTTVEAGS